MLHVYAHQLALTVKNPDVAQPFPPLPTGLAQWTHEHGGHGSMAIGSHHNTCLNLSTRPLGTPSPSRDFLECFISGNIPPNKKLI